MFQLLWQCCILRCQGENIGCLQMVTLFLVDAAETAPSKSITLHNWGHSQTVVALRNRALGSCWTLLLLLSGRKQRGFVKRYLSLKLLLVFLQYAVSQIQLDYDLVSFVHPMFQYLNLFLKFAYSPQINLLVLE